jgi:hypothetical protein
MTIMARAAAVERSTQIDGKALAFANYALCLALARGDRGHAAEMFAARHPNSIHKNIIQKAATSAQTVADFVQADFKPFGDAFIDLLRPRSIVGQIQDAFVRVPFNIKVPRQTAGSSCGWTGEGRPAQLSALAFDNFEFEFAKIAGIVAFSKNWPASPRSARSLPPSALRALACKALYSTT